MSQRGSQINLVISLISIHFKIITVQNEKLIEPSAFH